MSKTIRTVRDARREQMLAEAKQDAKHAAGFVDLTPTWSGIVRLFMAALEDGNHTAKDAARTELTRMAAIADAYVSMNPKSTVGPDHENTRTSVAHNAERESVRATHHVRNESLFIKSDITPETVYFRHYPGQVVGDSQLHVHVVQGIRGHSIYLREADALLVRDFLNEFYPAK